MSGPHGVIKGRNGSYRGGGQRWCREQERINREGTPYEAQSSHVNRG